MAEISIPGDPGGLTALASQLRAAADQIGTVQGRVAANGLQGSWSGDAAEAFRASLHQLPGELAGVSAAFEEAAQALSSFASRLTDLQQRAQWYERQIETARQEESDSRARQAQAQTALNAAHLHYSLATDPVSLHTAKQALELGESSVRQAVAEVDDAIGRISRLMSEAVTLRQEYQAAVNACCGALDGVRHSSGSSLAWLGSAIFGLMGHMDGGIGVWWHNGGRRLLEDADNVHDLAGMVGWLVEHGVPVSKLGGWAVPIVREANNPLFKGAGKMFLPLAAYGAYEDLRTAFGDSSGENLLGTGFTLGWTGTSDAFLLWPPAGYANLITGGALSADLNGVGLIGGRALSTGTDGALAAYRADTADRASGNYLGLAWNVGGAYASGSVSGALQGDAQFAGNAASGQYGGIVKGFARAENFVIEHPGDVPAAGAHAAESAAKGAWHAGGRLLSAL